MTTAALFTVSREKFVILSEGELVVFDVLARCRGEATGALFIAK
jgi:hypothetical protein